jgi:hypothetical protein
MKQIRRLAVIVVILIAALIVIGTTAVSAQTGGYTLDWFSTNSGGQAAGGVYAWGGISGQPEAGVLSSGAYMLSGGFWQKTDFKIYLPIVLR